MHHIINESGPEHKSIALLKTRKTNDSGTLGPCACGAMALPCCFDMTSLSEVGSERTRLTRWMSLSRECMRELHCSTTSGCTVRISSFAPVFLTTCTRMQLNSRCHYHMAATFSFPRHHCPCHEAWHNLPETPCQCRVDGANIPVQISDTLKKVFPLHSSCMSRRSTCIKQLQCVMTRGWMSSSELCHKQLT